MLTLSAGAIAAFVTEKIVPGSAYRRVLRQLDAMTRVAEKQQTRIAQLERKLYGESR